MAVQNVLYEWSKATERVKTARNFQLPVKALQKPLQSGTTNSTLVIH